MSVYGKNVSWFVAVVLAALCESVWPEALKIQDVLPSLSIILVVYFAVAETEERAMYAGMLAGVFEDVSSNDVLGHHGLGLVIMGYVTGRIATRLVTEHPAVKAGLVLMAALGYGFIFHSVAFIQNPENRFLPAMVTVAIPQAFYSALISPFVFLPLNWIFARFNAPEGSAP